MHLPAAAAAGVIFRYFLFSFCFVFLMVVNMKTVFRVADNVAFIHPF